MPEEGRCPNTLACITSGAVGGATTPFSGYRLEIGDDNTAIAFDELGSVIVTVHFDDYEELCSESFREYLGRAVATTVSGEEYYCQEDAIPNSQNTFLAAWHEEEGLDGDLFREEVNGGTSVFSDDQRRQLQCDEDYALACALQAQENEFSYHLDPRVPCPSFLAESDFPPLAFPKTSEKPLAFDRNTNETRQALLVTSSANKKVPDLSAAGLDDLPIEMFGYTRPADELANPRQFLDRGRGDLRAVASQYAQDEDDNDTRSSKPPLPEFRGRKTRSKEQSSEPAEYSRKSMRKLVRDMLHAGWRPLKVRCGVIPEGFML